MITKNDIREALHKLGRNADEIADTLYNKGFQGCRHKGENCPLANYLAEQFPDAAVNVGFGATSVKTRSTFFLVNTPKPCKRFIYNFDNGFYPRLIDGDS